MDYLTEISPVPNKPNKKMKIVVFILIIAGVLLIGGGTYYIYINKLSKNEKEVETIRSQIELLYGQNHKIDLAIDKDDKKNIKWECSNPELVSVDSNGNLSINSNQDGTVVITAKTEDGEVVADVTIDVSKIENIIPVTGVVISNKTLSIKYGETKKISTTISPTDATNKGLIWTSSNPALLGVDSSGKISPNANIDGTATITVQTIDGNYTDTANVKVEAINKTKKVTGIALNKTQATLNYGAQINVSSTVSPADATNKNVVWTSSDPTIVSVDEKGNIKAVGNKDATVTVTAKTVDGGYTKKVKITVKSIKVTGIKLKKNSMTLRYGLSTTLTPTITPSNAADKVVTWTSSNPKAVVVNEKGEISAVGSGKSVITATTKDGGYKATCTVTVDRKTFTATFNSNGGTAITKQSVLEGTQVKEPTAPTKQGYVFTGWLLNGASYDFNSKMSADITLTASWRTDYNAVDYCSNIPAVYTKDGTSLKPCIKNYVISTEAKKINRFMQNFSITSKYIYFINPLNGAWLSGFAQDDLNNVTKYNSIIDSDNFEKISTVYINRVDKATGQAKFTQVKYSGHGQGFDTASGDTDVLYLTTVAHPFYSNGKVGAASSGISYTSFKEEGGTRVPGVTLVFNSNGAVADRLVSTNFTQNGSFSSALYFNKIKEYAKNSSMRKQIISMAIDEKNNKLVYSVGKKTYIYSLSAVKNGSATGPIKQFNTYSNQGLELDGDNLYVTTNSGTIITIHKYSISTGAKIKTVEMDLASLYSTRIAKGNGIECEGLSVYNGKLYLGMVSREDGVGYNDIYLVDNF